MPAPDPSTFVKPKPKKSREAQLAELLREALADEWWAPNWADRAREVLSDE